MTDIIESECRETAHYWASKFGASTPAAYAIDSSGGEIIWSGKGTLEQVIGDAMNHLAVQHHAWWALIGTTDGRWFTCRHAVDLIPEHAAIASPERVAAVRELLSQE